MDKKKRPRRSLRRFLQFRLSTLLIVITMFSVFLAIKVYREPLTPSNLDQVREVNKIEEDIWAITWSPDRQRVAFIRWEKPVEIRESLTFIPIKTFGQQKKIIHFTFSADSDVAAYCENNSLAIIQNQRTGKTIELETGNAQPRLAFSPDGKLLATGGYGSAAKVWDVQTGELLASLDCGPTVGGLTAIFSPDGQKVAVGNRNSVTRIFDTATGKRLQELSKRSTHQIAFHPSGKVLAVAYCDGNIGLWDADTGKQIAMRNTGAEEIYRLDFSPQGDMLASSGRKADISIWSGDDLTLLKSLPAPEWVIGLKFSPDGAQLLTAGGTLQPGKREIKIWGVNRIGTFSEKIAKKK